MSCSWTGVSISPRSGCLSTLPVRPSWSACNHGATVDTRPEHPQQLLARNARAARSLLVVAAELLLEQPVVAARLLLLAQLQQVLALLDTATAVLTRRIRATLDRALLGETALALEEQLHP